MSTCGGPSTDKKKALQKKTHLAEEWVISNTGEDMISRKVTVSGPAVINLLTCMSYSLCMC